MLQYCCFNMEGWRTRRSPPGLSSVRLIELNGRVTVYRRLVKVSELMREHKSHIVCRSDSFFIGQKVPALSASDELQLGQSYFLLPNQLFQTVLSFVSIASLLAKGDGGSVRQFDIHMTDAGKMQIRLVERIEEEEKGVLKGDGVILCTTPALVKKYEQLVRCKSRKWRPKLEAIAEFPERRKKDALLVGLGCRLLFRKSSKSTM